MAVRPNVAAVRFGSADRWATVHPGSDSQIDLPHVSPTPAASGYEVHSVLGGLFAVDHANQLLPLTLLADTGDIHDEVADLEVPLRLLLAALALLYGVDMKLTRLQTGGGRNGWEAHVG